MNFNFTASILFFVFLFSNLLKAQNGFEDFQKEKTYIQTSHVFYKPGDVMDFKIYIVNAQNNLPAELSKVVNFEVIDPSGSMVKKSKYEIKNGYAKGFFYFNRDMKGGIYKIKAYTSWMQNETGKSVFEKEITLQKIVSPRILMKLDFPKKGYGAGDEVLADFSMRSLANLPIPFHEGVFTVMDNGEIVLYGKFITDKDGKCLLKFKLPSVLKSTDGILTMKVYFDGFIESISRNIPIVLNNLDVKFMPEGGTFINGIEQNVAFKILDEFEKPVDATLAIFNQNHEKIKEVSAFNFGMGNFLFVPKKGETYYAKVVKPENISTVYSFPVAKDEGVVFNIDKENQQIILRLNSTQEKNISIKGNFRGKEIYSKDLSLNKGINTFTISENDLPTGICRFTVYENNFPLAERIVFANENKRLNIKIKPVKKNYLPREKVLLDIETTDESNKPIPANLALGVVDDKLWTYADDKQNHIISWFLMDSELKGKIEKPQFYFDKKEQKAEKSLDLVMLTNGYRYFELIPEVIKTGKYKYLPEKRNPIYGIVEDENKKPVKADVFLLENEGKDKKILKQTTSENGLFYFSDLDYLSGYKIIAKSLQPKQDITIRILSYKVDINPLTKQKIKNIDVEEIVNESFDRTSLKMQNERTMAANKIVLSGKKIKDSISKEGNIGEVIVVGALGISKRDMITSAVTNVQSRELLDPNTGAVLNAKVAGILIDPSPNSRHGIITVRGISSLSNKNPVFIVDGVPVENYNLNNNDVGSVTVLKDAAATALYGSQGANGVFLITSKSYGNSNLSVDITPKKYFAVIAVPRDSLVFYELSRQFSYPAYKTTTTSYRHDYRENVYWNSVVETDKNGKVRVEFYNSDANTTFRIITEGISGSGLLGRDETTYAVQSLISIDAKIPQYLTRTDQMKIPVVIKNNSSEIQKLSLDVIVPNRVKLMKSDSLITLKPLESGRLFVTVQTDEVVDSNIQFTVRSGDFRETMILPFKVEEKGFPHYYLIINNKSENIEVNIPEYIDRSLFSSYYVFENSALQMFEDLERFKKEPYGCFEQLSSTVYPNIFILDYLRSSKKISNKDEELVIKNLKKGFQKMLSYKNEDGGFGYFTSSESDVSLSAFALLEFKELKKYVNIEPKLIQNLTSFILSKKNKNGLFEVRKSYEMNKPYSEYSWSRNIYVLYALSKLGFKNEIEDSYNILLKRVLASKDSYQLALMTNVSANLGKDKDFENLMQILDQQYESQNVKPIITFTGSKGISANAETLSLYMMALQKDAKLNELKIAEVADELIGYNGYFGFGSTQATSLAVEVLSDFFAKNEKLYSSEKPKIRINGAEVFQNLSMTSAYKTGKNDINVEYSSATKKGLPYKLEYQYYTLNAPKSSDIPLVMETKLKSETSKVGETNRMTVTIKNTINGDLPMTTAKIGIPAGLTLQNALLKDMIDKKQVSYYEIFDNYLVLYWEHFDANETKVINLDLKVEFAGEYTGKSSNVYLYYMPEAKYWNQGIKAKIEP